MRAFALDSLSLETEAGLSSREVRELADAARGLYHIAAGGVRTLTPCDTRQR